MADPVKIVLQRRPRSGKTEVFQAWARELVQSAASLAVVEGSSVLAAEGGSHFILLRFANQAELGRWQSDPAARALLARGDELAEEPGSPVIHEQ